MKNLPDDSLPPELEESIEGLLIASREARLMGNAARAEDLLTTAWERIPEPRLKYGTGQILAQGAIRVFLQARQFTKARRWLALLEPVYGKHDMTTLRFRGQIAFEEGAMDEAEEAFSELLSRYGERGFRELEPKYLEFARSLVTRPAGRRQKNH